MCRVLILDDDVFVANSIKSMLESSGRFTPEVCLRLEDALRIAQNAGEKGKPFEILLIDMHLRDEKDGIQAMLELQENSPEADAIIFTGFEDPEDGILAYKAGALRYMTKPIQREELLFVVNALVQKHQQEVEQRWQKIFIEMTESALHEKGFSEVAWIVLDHSIRLGFERTHLFWVPRREDATPQKDSLLGIGCKGVNCIPQFSRQTYKLADLGTLSDYLKTHDVSLVQPPETEGIFQSFRGSGFISPVAAWVLLPLWSREELVGCLTLDYGSLERSPRPFELDLLNFFARQVSVVLENSSLHINAERTLKETEIIGDIGRQVSTKAATQDLTQLLEKVREHLGQLLDTANFSIFLFDEERREIDFSLHYENNTRKNRRLRAAGHSLEEFIIRQEEVVYIPEDVEGFARQNQLKIQGKIPTCWLGAPMCVGEKIIGGIIIQKFSGKKLPETDKIILAAAANQVAGAIQISKYSSDEARDSERVQLLNSASLDLMHLAQKKKDLFWLTVLTLATADFGLGFNRAMLFLARDNCRRLQGEAGVGTEDSAQAIRDWKRDRARNFNFDKFLKTVGTKRMRLTPFHTTIKQIDFLLDGENELIQSVLDGSLVAVSEKDAALNLPAPIRENFSLSNCIMLPLRAGDKTLGLVIVDNKHNGKPLDERTLNRLLLLLDNAGLVWEIVQNGEKTRELLDATQEITASVTHQPLNEILNRICQKARLNSEADWAIIYPIRPGKAYNNLEFDLSNFGCDGHLKSPREKLVANQPRVGGVSKHVMNHGVWVVEDVDKEDKSIGKFQQLSEHHFIREEGVKALIGIAVRDPYNNDPLGIFYLDYDKPRKFSETEQHHARAFANLAAIAIASLRRLDEQRQRKLLQASLAVSEVVGDNIGIEDILSGALGQLKEIFPDTGLCVLLYDKDDHALKFAQATLKYYTIKNPSYKSQHTFPLDQIEKGSIACKVARKALESRLVETCHVPDVTQEAEYLPLNPATRSEFCISLMKEDGILLGILALERAKISFEEDDISLIKTVARELSLAIARNQEREYTLFQSSIAAMTSWASELAHDIKNEIGQIRSLAYLLQTAAPNDAEIQEYASSIDKSAQKLASVGPWTEDQNRLIPLDHALTTFLAELAHDRDLGLELDLHLGETAIWANPQELKRVLSHLVRNAARAMLNTSNKKIQVISRLHLTKSAHVEIIFKDFGPGVDEKVRNRILQIPATTKERSKEQGGYGLLFIRQLIEEMGGTIRLLNPNDNTGAAFSIALPIASEVE